MLTKIILELLQHEEEENRLNLLTQIGLETANKDIFHATEEARAALSTSSDSVSRRDIEEEMLRNPVVETQSDTSLWQDGITEDAVIENCRKNKELGDLLE